MPTVVIGSIGVGILLIAFVLNLRPWVSRRSYLAMNVLGAGLAGVYAWQVGSIPFVILEIVWAGVALCQLILTQKKGLPE